MKKSLKSVHLVCNAHLDPVWLWEWEEGAAEAISTFRIAADFCEQYEGFVFNHNEVILYKWVEEYEPALFKRIQRLVKDKRWHIMGGWYLQPDCNMPSGESFVRQILLGRSYFREKFGVAPTTAINFDSFGHTRGLVQILAKSGFDSYLFCRPGQKDCKIERDEFIWEGYDGSRILAGRASDMYLSARGAACSKVKQIIEKKKDLQTGIVLWGVGNHGGEPSRIDLENLSTLIKKSKDIKIKHSTPEAYFKELQKQTLPVHSKDLNTWAPGCYTSQVNLKQKHRLLENELYMTEKMASSAWCQEKMAYPESELREAEEDLAGSEFHDILPGSSIQAVEKTSLRLMDHGLENLSRVKARSFFVLAREQQKAKSSETPILVYNPHPFSINTLIECEFQLADQNREGTFTQCIVHQKGKALPTQVEKEVSNLPLDWRKRVVFPAKLYPSQMNRFDCRFQLLPRKPKVSLKDKGGQIHFKTDDIEVIISTRTGLIDRYQVKGDNYLMKNSCRPLVIHDNADTWGMDVKRFRKKAGVFRLLSRKESAQVSGQENNSLPSVRVVEDGPVRAVVEAVFGYGHSLIWQRYKLPRQGACVEIETRVHWQEKDRMLKLSFPTPYRKGKYMGQVAYGCDTLTDNGNEVVAQKWVAAISQDRRTSLTIINEGIYGSDFLNGEIRLSLLRSPAYSGEFPLPPQDRYIPRIDQGETIFRIWLNAGFVSKRLNAVDREALVCNEKPMVLSFFPSGSRKKPKPFVTLSDKVVQITTLKKSCNGSKLVLRLFEPTGHKRTTEVKLPFAGMRKNVTLEGFEIRTYLVDIRKRTWTPATLMGKSLK